MIRHIYTKDEKVFLNKIIPGHKYKEIIELFKEKFKIELTINQVKGYCANNGLKTGCGGFKKGYTPHNKGKKIQEYMSKESIENTKKTRFKKGRTPTNKAKIGSEYIDGVGDIMIKVAEPNVWMKKRVFMWEKYNNRKAPKGCAIIFADRNHRNFSKDNLIMITRKELLKLNELKLIKEDINITKTGINVVKLINKIKEVEKDV